mmetsp:Transcript_635/g.1157  ORF Transcript_635/g.1157 Transcript_635/m.1157 type:complete len:114 (-) Transcript_635:92-433(-)
MNATTPTTMSPVTQTVAIIAFFALKATSAFAAPDTTDDIAEVVAAALAAVLYAAFTAIPCITDISGDFISALCVTSSVTSVSSFFKTISIILVLARPKTAIGKATIAPTALIT